MYSISYGFYGSVKQYDNQILWKKKIFTVVKIVGQAMKGFARTILNRRLLPIGHRKRGYEE